MDELIRNYPTKVAALAAFIVAGVIGGLYKMGWLKIGRNSRWDGRTERRECPAHQPMAQKVCSLYSKLEEVDRKLDSVAEKLQFVLGTLEARWGGKR